MQRSHAAAPWELTNRCWCRRPSPGWRPSEKVGSPPNHSRKKRLGPSRVASGWGNTCASSGSAVMRSYSASTSRWTPGAPPRASRSPGAGRGTATPPRWGKRPGDAGRGPVGGAARWRHFDRNSRAVAAVHPPLRTIRGRGGSSRGAHLPGAVPPAAADARGPRRPARRANAPGPAAAPPEVPRSRGFDEGNKRKRSAGEYGAQRAAGVSSRPAVKPPWRRGLPRRRGGAGQGRRATWGGPGRAPGSARRAARWLGPRATRRSARGGSWLHARFFARMRSRWAR